MLTTSTRSQMAAALDEAQEILRAVEAGEFTSTAAFLVAANDARASLAAAMAQVSAELGVGSYLLRAAVEQLGWAVAELRLVVSDETREVVCARETSFVELAAEELGDMRRADELGPLNPGVRYPWRLLPGTTITMPRT